MAAAGLRETQVVEYAPAEVKKKVASSGRAGKEQVAVVLGKWLNLPQEAMKVLDATDALALAYCYFLEKQVSEKMRNLQDSSCSL